jgi:hypothetical protein
VALTQLLDLVGPQEIASRLGVAPNTVSMWRARGVLPEPLEIVSNTPVWHWPLIREWADRTGRLARVRRTDDHPIKVSPARHCRGRDAREVCFADAAQGLGLAPTEEVRHVR